jgi:cyanate permease
VFYASGQLLGPAVAGVLIDATGGFRSAFLLASLAMLLTLILTFRIHHSARTR